MKSGFKRTINWNKYQPIAKMQAQNSYLDYLINPSFQVVSGRFVLSFENNDNRTGNTGRFFPKVKIKDENVMFD